MYGINRICGIQVLGAGTTQGRVMQKERDIFPLSPQRLKTANLENCSKGMYMGACVSIERRRGKNRLRLEHKILVFNKTKKR